MRTPKPAHAATGARRRNGPPSTALVRPVAGDVLYLPDGTYGEDDDMHRRVVIACDAAEAVIISISTSDGSANTCPIAVGDMDDGVLSVPSFADYGQIRVGSSSGLARDLARHGSRIMARCSGELLARIVEGLRRDPRVRPSVAERFGGRPGRRILPG